MGRRKPKIIHEWKKPKEVSIHEMKELFRQGKAAAPRILIFTATLLFVLHHFLRSVLPEDFGVPFSKAFIVVFVIAVWGVCSFYVICPLIYGYSRCTYKITDEGIYASGVPRPWYLSWSMMQGYFLSKHEQLTEISVLGIDARGIGKRVYLPEDELARQIISSVAEKIPQMEQIPNSLKKIELSQGQYICLFLLAIVYLVSVAYYVVRCRPGSMIAFVLSGIALLGPGTLGLLLLFGKRFLKNRYLLAYAITLNMTVVAMTMLFTLLFLLYHFSKQIGQA